MAICGIATSANGPTVRPHELGAMCSALEHALVPEQFQVLPQIGLSATGAIALGSCWSSETLLVVCDAELVNTNEWRNTTIAEAIGRLYVAEGPAFIKRLRGAFALAIWDHKTRSIMLAVDRFGIKELCYAANHLGLVFASQPRAVFASQRIPKKVNLSAITEYLVYNVVPIPKTAFEEVSRVAPGEYVVWSDKGTEKRRYWDMRYPEDEQRSKTRLAEELMYRMENAVRVTSAGLDPAKTGCFLSGGTDSSSIVGLLTRIHGSPVNAFSIGFSEDRFNELDYARIAARHFHAQHEAGHLGADESLGVVDKIVSAYDEPFGNSSAIPTYCCAALARVHGIEVLLAGDGGDELFGGNERYREEQIFALYKKVPDIARRWLIEPAVFGSPLKNGVFGKARKYIRLANMSNPDRYCRWRLLRLFSPDLVLESSMPVRNGHSDLLAIIRKYHDLAPASTELNRLLYIDVKMTLGDDDLPKVTRMAGLAGVRVRFPYLDHELAEFSGRLPAAMKVRGLEKRYLFKRATRNLLPETILRKKKHGFGLPIGFWLKSHPAWHAWAKEILYDPKTYQRGYFRRDFIEQLFRNMKQDDTPYFGDLLWVFLMLELWHRRHVEGNSCCV